jgi:hypothetical protein
MNRLEVLHSFSQNHPAGEKLTALSKEELMQVNGGADVQGETTVLCAFGGGVAITIALSKLFTC